MKSGFHGRRKPIVKALKKAGFKVNEVIKQEKKTVIIVTHDAENTGRRLKENE